MKRNLFMTNHGFMRRWTSFVLVIVFGMTSFLMPAKASAQSVGISGGLSVGVATVAGLKEYQGLLSDQPANVRGAVTGSLVENGRDVVVSSSLIENARPGDVTVASPSAKLLNIQPVSFTDSKTYMLTGAVSSGWSVSMDGVVDNIQGFGLDAATSLGSLLASHPWKMSFAALGAAYFISMWRFVTEEKRIRAYAKEKPVVQVLAKLSNIKVNYFLRMATQVESLRTELKLEYEKEREYTVLRNIVFEELIKRGGIIIPELLEVLKNPNVSENTVSDIAYIVGMLHDPRVVDSLIDKLNQNIAVDQVVRALGRIGDDKAISPLEQYLRRASSKHLHVVALTLARFGQIDGAVVVFNLMTSGRRTFFQIQDDLEVLNDHEVFSLFEDLKKMHSAFDEETYGKDSYYSPFAPSYTLIIHRYSTLYQKFLLALPLAKRELAPIAQAYEILSRGNDFGIVYTPGEQKKLFSSRNELYTISVGEMVSLKEIFQQETDNPSVASSAIMGTYKARAVLYFGRKGFKGTIPSLLKLLGHPNLQFRFDAGEILVELGVTKEQMVDAYIAALRSDNISGVIQKLGELGDARAIEPLLPFVGSSNYHYAQEALEKLNVTKEQMVDAYIAALGKDHATINAIQKLGELGDVRAIEPLLPLLSGSNYTDVETALEKLNVAKDKMINQYRRVATSSNDLAQANALLKLGEYGDIEFLIVLLQSDKINGHGKVSVRHIFNQLNVTDPRVLLYDRAYQELQSQVRQGAGDVGIKYPHQLNQVYHILLRGGEFRVDYYTTSFERNLTSEEIAQWEKYDIFDHPLTIPDTTTEHVEELIITEVTKSDGGDVASAAVTASTPVGGIDFNSAGLDLQIKRDDKGVALPLPQQTIQNMKIDGFYPVIINIAPIQVPLLFGMQVEKEPQKLSAL